MREILPLTSQIISGLSLIANVYLLYIYQVCPIRGIKSYKYSFLATAVQNILFSICIILIVPMPASSNFAFALVAVGPLRTHFVGQYLIVLYVLFMLISLLIVTNSFIFRYVHICKIHLVDSYLSACGVCLTLLVNFAICLAWTATAIIVLWPNPQIIKQYKAAVFTIAEVDPYSCAQLCFSLENGLQDPLRLCWYTSILVLLSSTIVVIVWTTIQIKKTLKQASMNENVGRMHRKLLSLLLSQTACPILLLYIPSIVTVVFMFTGAEMTFSIAYPLDISHSLYPLLSSLLIIGFLNEYRERTLKILCLFKNRDELPL